MTTYDNVVKAAQRLLTDETKDTWALADAVLAHVPDATATKVANLKQGTTVPDSPDVGVIGQSVPQRIAALAAQMKDDGVITQKGTSYTASTLTHFREAAVAWPKDDRYDEASFSTHQAAADSKDARLVLKALVNVARGGSPVRPRGFDLAAWNKSLDRVQSRTRAGFRVTVDDIRVARKQNVARRPRHRKMTLDRINKLIDAFIEGNVEEEDLFNILPTKVGTQTAEEYVDEYVAEVDRQIAEREAREAALRAQVAAGEEGMTDQELAESDEELTALGATADQTRKASEDAEQDYAGGPALQAANRADREAGMALVLGKKHGIPTNDVDRLHVVATSLRHKADLIDMMAEGSGFSAEDEKLLSDLGIA
jgi:hypothetical protein